MSTTGTQADNKHGSTTRYRSRGWERFINMGSCLRLDAFTVLQMLKGGLPPLIVIAMYQATSIAEIESTLGYLAAILTVSAQCLLPRAKFMKIMSFSVFATCVGAALSSVAVVCCVRVRQFSTSTNDYNSSASVVSAVWLLFGIWLANSIRAHRPAELQDPMVALSIFLVVALTTTPTFLTVSEGLEFVRRLLITFMIGLSVASAVSLFVLPITSRRNVFRAMNAYTNAIDEVFDGIITFVKEKVSQVSENVDEQIDHQFNTSARPGGHHEQLLAARLNSLGGVLSQIDAELPYTKIEVAWGKLSSGDLIRIRDHLNAVFMSLAGLSTLPEISQVMLEENFPHQGLTNQSEDTDLSTGVFKGVPVWRNMVDGLQMRLTSTRELVIEGLRASFDLLEISSSDTSRHPKDLTVPDLEGQNGGSGATPSSRSKFFYKEIAKYKQRRQNQHQIWPSLMFPAQVDSQAIKSDNDEVPGGLEVRKHLLVFLFMEQLQNEALQAVHDLLAFAEGKVKTGAMHRNRMIIPNYQQFALIAPLADMAHHHSAPVSGSASMGTRTWTSKDAEHLSPANWWERLGNHLRVLSKMLTSQESKFGARVAMASVSVAILAYIRQTHTWFTQERVIWVMVVIVIGMKAESGASTFGYLARIGGTTISMILSFIVWYIVNGHTAGVLIFLYFANVFEYYFWVRYPQFLGPCTIMIVTFNVIIAYELQVKKLGIEEATSNDQPYLPIYLFGPYKLLCVIIAVTISFFWTIFPSPASAGSQVRRNLGQGLFLLANFYSSTHQAIKLWINEQQGDMQDPNSVGRRLQTLNQNLFSRQIALTTQNLALIHWTSYEVSLGGRFPQELYKSAISNIRMLTTCMALMIHATRNIETTVSALDSSNDSETLKAGSDSNSGKQDRWIHQLALATKTADFDAHTTTSILCHLAGAISSNSALPPFLTPSGSFFLAQRVREINVQAMHIDNIRHPEFLAFASLEVASSLINKRLTNLIIDVKDLVGEIDFEVGVPNLESKGTKAS